MGDPGNDDVRVDRQGPIWVVTIDRPHRRNAVDTTTATALVAAFEAYDADEHAKAIPYGVYDVGNDQGWVSVGDVADTAEFAVASIRRWWDTLGRARFADAARLMITADAGGSNGYRVRAWSGTWRSSPRRPAWRSRCATTRPAPPSGTRSSTACSASSP